jgi:hypothetical protein
MKKYQLISDLFNCIVLHDNDYIGSLKDIYFDDVEWQIRYFVVEITTNDSISDYLLSAMAIKEIDLQKKTIIISISINTILNSPTYEQDKPISRQYEIALHRYYEWPEYWGQSEFFDTPGIKHLNEFNLPLDDMDNVTNNLNENDKLDISDKELPLEPTDGDIDSSDFSLSEEDDRTFSTSLRSFREIQGYIIQTNDTSRSIVKDFIIDLSSFSIVYLIINLGFDQHGEYTLLTLHWLKAINWRKSQFFIDLSQQQLENAPRYKLRQNIDIPFEKTIYQYYDSL